MYIHLMHNLKLIFFILLPRYYYDIIIKVVSGLLDKHLQLGWVSYSAIVCPPSLVHLSQPS